MKHDMSDYWQEEAYGVKDLKVIDAYRGVRSLRELDAETKEEREHDGYGYETTYLGREGLFDRH